MYRINYVAIFIIISFSTSIVFAYSPPLTPPKILNKDKPTYNKKPVDYNGTESQTSMIYYNKGTNATLSGDFDEAVENYRLALEADSMFIEDYKLLDEMKR